jgi:PAS domain S-box-containing protein
VTKILIVDDEPKNLYLLQVLLTSNGYELSSASNGAEALELALHDKPDVIISDILMPVMDGFSLCRACKEDERLRDIPFIFYTATYTYPKDEALALSLGAERFIIKPTEPEQFLVLLKETVEKFAAGKLVARRGKIASEEYYKEHNAALIRKLEGKVAELEETNRKLELDIEARRKAEDALRESENNYATLVDNASVGVYQAGLDGTILFANQELARMGNFESAADLVGSNTLIHYKNPEDRPRLYEILKKEGRVRNFETEMLTRDGHTRTVLLNAMQDGKTITGMISDITDRKQIEETLKESEERFRTAFQYAPGGKALIDLDGRLLRVNRALCRTLGYSEAELLKMTFQEITHPDDLDTQLAYVHQLVAGEIPNFQMEKRIFDKNRQVIYVLLSMSLVKDHAGQPLYFISQIQDITENKRAADALHNSIDLLNITGQIAKVGGWEVIIETQTLNWTEEVYRIHEVEPGTRLNVADAINFYAPESQPVISAAVQACTELGTPWDLELPLITARGRHIWVRAQGRAEGQDGKIVRIYGAFQDITYRKTLEERQKRSMALLDITGQLARVGGWEYNVEFDEMFGTETLYQIFEVDPSVNVSLSDAINFFPQALRPVISEAVQNCIDHGTTWSQDLPLTTAGGRQKVVNVIIRTELNEGKTIRLLGAVQDVTERKRAEDALGESEERYRLISTVASDYMYSCRVGTDGKLTQNWVAGAFEQITGYTFEEFIAHGGWRSILHPDDLVVDDRDMKNLYTNQSIISEIRIITKSGQIVWVQVYAQPAWDAKSNKLVGIYGAVQNITERKLAEEKIRRQTSRAEALVKTAGHINSSLKLDAVLNAVCEETAHALDVPCVAINLVDLASQTISFVATYGLPPIYRQKRMGMPLASFSEVAGQPPDVPIIVPDLQSVPGQIGAGIDQALDFRTSVSISIKNNAVFLGRLNVFTTGKVRHFSDDELALLQGLSNQAAQAITNAHLFERTERHLKYIEALHSIDVAIVNSLDVRLSLKVLIDEVIRQLGVDAASVFLYKPVSNILEFTVGVGFRTSVMKKKILRLGEGLAGRVALERQQMHIPNLADTENEFTRDPLFFDEGFVTYFGTPLIAKGQVIGVFEVFHRSPLTIDNDWANFLDTLAGQAAIAIDSIQSFERLQESNIKLVMAYDATIEGWSRAMDLRDKETEGHTLRVTQLTVELARGMGISEEEIIHVMRGALLHDIGKLGVPDRILLKPGKLTEEEWAVMRQHPQYAYDMLSSIEYLRPALDIPFCHHEKWDGGGYPRGLKGEQIPLAARIFAVVDVWDALTSDRPYRKAWPCEQTLEYIREQSGKHFDPQVVKAFFESMDQR